MMDPLLMDFIDLRISEAFSHFTSTVQGFNLEGIFATLNSHIQTVYLLLIYYTDIYLKDVIGERENSKN